MSDTVTQKPRRRLLPFFGFLAGMALLGFLAQFQWIGHVVLLIYAIVALKIRLSARITFVGALLALGMVPVGILSANWIVAQNFAAYAFVLFVFGIVSMTIDLQRELHPSRSKINNVTDEDV